MQTRKQHTAVDALPEILETVTAMSFSLLKILGGAYGLVLLLVFALQRKLLFIPPPSVVDPSMQGGEAEIIILPAGSGPEQHAAVWFKPKRPEAPVLVHFHGNADQLGWGTAFLGRYFQSQHDLGLYGIEYPGYGLARPGSPSEESIYIAAQAMLDHLEQDLGVPRARVVLFGQSVGCAVAVEMAKRGYGSKLLLLSPFTSILDISQTVYPFLSPALRLAPQLVRDKFDNEAKAGCIRIPTLVVHGEVDEIVPPQMGQTLERCIPETTRKTFVLVQGMGHNDAFDREDVLLKLASFARSGHA